MKKGFLIVFSLMLLLPDYILAADHVVDLTVSYKTVYFQGKSTKAIAVNNKIPAPTLHFKEGDTVTLNVHNNLDKETAIHWHGIILPWQMDGVLGITQNGIPPGETFKYKFKLRQSGTYWYHAHAGLQEQEGLYGAFIIDPKTKPSYHYDKDYVIVLSDWSNTKAHQIHANLKKSGEYYAPRFPLQASLAKFISDYKKSSDEERKNLLMDYKMMQHMRMGIYDISDVAYDKFLLNGHSNEEPWQALVKEGDVVSLRFINAGGSTFFRIKIPDTRMQMVHVQGNDVVPYFVNDFSMGPGETNDVLVKIEKDKPYIIYAESSDTLGAVSGALITKEGQLVSYENVNPFPEPLPVTREIMANEKKRGLSNTQHGATHSSVTHETLNQQPKININTHNMKSHINHQQEMKSHVNQRHAAHNDVNNDINSVNNNHDTQTIGTKYQKLSAKIQTNDPGKPIYKTINLSLSGFMDRYIWFINGVPGYQAKPIKFEAGKRYRLVFTNDSMMHHPMHLHGHWFILRNGHGSYDPLLHTIDVPPGSKVIADVDADASGQWFFHCHMLYHMVSGMERVFQYDSLLKVAEGKEKPEYIIDKGTFHNRPIVRIDEARPVSLSLVTNPHPHPQEFYFSNKLDIGADPFNNKQNFTYKGLYGRDFNKLQIFINDAEVEKGKIENADLDIFYWRLIDQFWAVKGGINYFYRPSGSPYWQPGIGIEGLMPYFIETDARLYYHDGSLKLDMEIGRNTQLTNNLFLGINIRAIAATKTIVHDEIGSGFNNIEYSLNFNYRFSPVITAFIEYEYKKYYGRLKSIRNSNREKTSENSVFLGFSFLF